MHHLHINPSEIENWDFYEYQYTINNLVEHLKREKDRNKEQEEQTTEKYSGITSSVKGLQPGSFKGTDKYLSGINPKAGLSTMNLKAPSLKVPKL